nr:hypothetical protein [Streptomyces sp. 846.5]
MVLAVVGTWVALTVPFMLPGPFLPSGMLPVFYSHATVGLWFLSILVVPVMVLVRKRVWVRTGRWSRTQTAVRPAR